MRRKGKWTREKLDHVRELHASGATNKEMARMLGCSVEAMRSVMAYKLNLRANVKPPKGRKARDVKMRIKRSPSVPVLNPRKGMFDSTAAVNRLCEMWAA